MASIDGVRVVPEAITTQIEMSNLETRQFLGEDLGHDYGSRPFWMILPKALRDADSK